MATHIITPSADAHVLSSSAIYTNARAGTGLNYNSTASELAFGQEWSGSIYRCWEAFLQFDLSTVGGVIRSVSLTLEYDAFASGGTIEVRERPWVGSTAAWVAGASLGSYTLLGSGNDVAFSEVTIPLTGLTPGSTLDLMINTSDHRTGKAPTGAEYGEAYSVDVANSTLRPYLTVTTAGPSSFGTVIF